MSSALLGSSPDLFTRHERQKAFAVTWEHKGSAFGRFGYLPHCDLVPWDQERAKAPERSYPKDGAVCRLYDTKRKEKDDWKPTTWSHHGPSFPPVKPLATSLSAPALRELRHKALQTVKGTRPRGRSESKRASEDGGRSMVTAATAATTRRHSCSSPSKAGSKESHAGSVSGESRRSSKAAVPEVRTRRLSEPWKIFGEILVD
eukprot:Skav204734  [mRNA]  locus=scaffold1854:139695:140303:+ [translate_table: standard]